LDLIYLPSFSAVSSSSEDIQAAVAAAPTPYVDPLLNHDFSGDSREQLLDIINDLRNRLSLSERNMAGARTDRDRYASLVAKTNESLLLLKEKVDINIDRMTAKAGEHKEKITSLQNKLAKEEEKKSGPTLPCLPIFSVLNAPPLLPCSAALSKKLRSFERKLPASDGPDRSPLERKASAVGGRKRSGNVVPQGLGSFAIDSFGLPSFPETPSCRLGFIHFVSFLLSPQPLSLLAPHRVPRHLNHHNSRS